MADKTIGELPDISSLDADSLFVAEQRGQAVKVSGKQLTDFSNVETTAQVEQAKASAQEAKTAQTAAEAAILKGPVIQNGTWWVYNQTAGAYQDTGINATGPKGDTGPTSSVNGISPDDSGNIKLDAANILRADGATDIEAALAAILTTYSKKVLPDIHNLDPVDGWTANNGWGGLWYAKTQEGIVILHIAAINDVGFSDSVQLATLPEGYRPARDEAAVGFSQAISDGLFGIDIDSIGRVHVRSLISGVTLKYIVGTSVFRASS